MKPTNKEKLEIFYSIIIGIVLLGVGLITIIYASKIIDTSVWFLTLLTTWITLFIICFTTTIGTMFILNGILLFKSREECRK